jgi:hypothetical protein
VYTVLGLEANMEIPVNKPPINAARKTSCLFDPAITTTLFDESDAIR